MKLLIVGDSFAADWRKKYPDAQGWPNQLAEHHRVDNLAQAGCSEYRIYQQLVSANLGKYDWIIVSHTSPYRIYTEYNPAYSQDALHHSCDLMYADVCNLAREYHDYVCVQEYFEKFFSLEYAEFCYLMLRKEIQHLIGRFPCLHIAHVDVPGRIDIDFSSTWKDHPGSINHYSQAGNDHVFDILNKKLTK